jgi:hypothetical protein
MSWSPAAPPLECRIKRLDLETGVERDTGLIVPGEFGFPHWLAGTLYVVTQTAIYRKWLLGLDTVRTTLRPCGFARALVRNLIYYFDLPFLASPLLGPVSIMFSDQCQRLGDRLADTIVVRAGTIRCDRGDLKPVAGTTRREVRQD